MFDHITELKVKEEKKTLKINLFLLEVQVGVAGVVVEVAVLPEAHIKVKSLQHDLFQTASARLDPKLWLLWPRKINWVCCYRMASGLSDRVKRRLEKQWALLSGLGKTGLLS